MRRHGRAWLGAHHQYRLHHRIEGGFGRANYAAAKAGMHGFTKALALEVAKRGVTVNTVSRAISLPGWSRRYRRRSRDRDHPQIPVGRLGQPEEIAALVQYLCSREAGFVTGANIAINGGQHMQ